MNQDPDLDDLRQRQAPFCHRTLRRQVLEYVQYTERRPMTQEFYPSDAEQSLYEAVSRFLEREDTYSIPAPQRHLTTLILRKILASSSYAVAGTMDTFRERLEGLLQEHRETLSLAERIIEGEELEPDLLDEWSEEPAPSLEDEFQDEINSDEDDFDDNSAGNGSINDTPARAGPAATGDRRAEKVRRVGAGHPGRREKPGAVAGAAHRAGRNSADGRAGTKPSSLPSRAAPRTISNASWRPTVMPGALCSSAAATTVRKAGRFTSSGRPKQRDSGRASGVRGWICAPRLLNTSATTPTS